MDIATLGELVMTGFRKLGFIRYAGIEGVEFAEGRNVVGMTPGPEHLNHNGDVHAAVLFGLAETAAMGAAVSGIAAHMAESFVVARDGRIEYLARAKGAAGPFLAHAELPGGILETMRAEAAARRPVEFTVPVRITGRDETAVATATFTAVIRPKRS
ncbi:PaaI family thioesterase [Nocardia harenae]|uniref:PaaI family thioesterase n=1 Tax=Nocardia harenae TaxID=358707 RepID=UPI00082AEB4A|nr:PaaI family thioesterase [Nocardia harenae]